MIADHARNEQVLVALRRITHAIDMHSRSVFLLHNLTGPQLFLMRDISRYGGLPERELSAHVEIGDSAVNDILDRLEKRGFVRKDQPADGGAGVLSVTEAGIAVLQHSPPLPRERFFEEFERLNEWEQSLILSTLQRVAVMLEGGSDVSPEADPGAVSSESSKQMA